MYIIFYVYSCSKVMKESYPKIIPTEVSMNVSNYSWDNVVTISIPDTVNAVFSQDDITFEEMKKQVREIAERQPQLVDASARFKDQLSQVLWLPVHIIDTLDRTEDRTKIKLQNHRPLYKKIGYVFRRCWDIIEDLLKSEFEQETIILADIFSWRDRELWFHIPTYYGIPWMETGTYVSKQEANILKNDNLEFFCDDDGKIVEMSENINPKLKNFIISSLNDLNIVSMKDIHSHIIILWDIKIAFYKKYPRESLEEVIKVKRKLEESLDYAHVVAEYINWFIRVKDAKGQITEERIPDTYHRNQFEPEKW